MIVFYFYTRNRVVLYRYFSNKHSLFRGSPPLDNLSSVLYKYTESEKKPELLITVYEPMAIAYKMLFESQKALIWFQKAFDIGPTVEMDIAKTTRLEKQLQHQISNIRE